MYLAESQCELSPRFFTLHPMPFSLTVFASLSLWEATSFTSWEEASAAVAWYQTSTGYCIQTEKSAFLVRSVESSPSSGWIAAARCPAWLQPLHLSYKRYLWSSSCHPKARWTIEWTRSALRGGYPISTELIQEASLILAGCAHRDLKRRKLSKAFGPLVLPRRPSWHLCLKQPKEGPRLTF